MEAIWSQVRRVEKRCGHVAIGIVSAKVAAGFGEEVTNA